MDKLKVEKQAALIEAQTWEDAFKSTVQDLNLKQNETDPDITQEVRHALTTLKKGETAPSEKIFRQTLSRLKTEGDNLEAAKEARHLSTLTFFHETQTALDAYREATSLDPEDAIAWKQLGRLLLRIGDLDGADEAFQKVLELERGHRDRMLEATGYTYLGQIYQLRGKLDQATSMYKGSLALNNELNHKEGMARSYANLGYIHRVNREIDKAKQMYKQSLALFTAVGASPESEQVSNLLSELADLKPEVSRTGNE